MPMPMPMPFPPNVGAVRDDRSRRDTRDWPITNGSGAVTPSGAELMRAQRTLSRAGTFFLGWEPDGVPRHDGPTGEGMRHRRARYLGNSLREFDRFLSVLTDEVEKIVGARESGERDFTRLHNAANKLGRVRALMGMECPDRDRLLAIGRVRACLHHCGGHIHDTTLRADVATSAGGDVVCIESIDGVETTRLDLSADAIRTIGIFYAKIARDLLSQLQRFEAKIDFTAICAPLSR